MRKQSWLRCSGSTSVAEAWLVRRQGAVTAACSRSRTTTLRPRGGTRSDKAQWLAIVGCCAQVVTDVGSTMPSGASLTTFCSAGSSHVLRAPAARPTAPSVQRFAAHVSASGPCAGGTVEQMGCEKALGERTHGEEGQDCCKGPSLTVRNPVHSQGYRGDCDGGGRAAMRAPLSIVVGPPPPGDSIRIAARSPARNPSDASQPVCLALSSALLVARRDCARWEIALIRLPTPPRPTHLFLLKRTSLSLKFHIAFRHALAYPRSLLASTFIH
ncbi:hypothetical protein BKA66DRAFT_236903 [Pyrenochaeta sp. MPI-SDFR-AT-0127]|nr:hypothetical protein BKA66DRAFT_236903 [Pyrenochaeta sp. MPI-SDFR-AT-0127]